MPLLDSMVHFGRTAMSESEAWTSSTQEENDRLPIYLFPHPATSVCSGSSGKPTGHKDEVSSPKKGTRVRRPASRLAWVLVTHQHAPGNVDGLGLLPDAYRSAKIEYCFKQAPCDHRTAGRKWRRRTERALCLTELVESVMDFAILCLCRRGSVRLTVVRSYGNVIK